MRTKLEGFIYPYRRAATHSQWQNQPAQCAVLHIAKTNTTRRKIDASRKQRVEARELKKYVQRVLSTPKGPEQPIEEASMPSRVKRCGAKDCESNSTDFPDIKFFTFPKNLERQKLWRSIVKIPEGAPSRFLCERHFSIKQFRFGGLVYNSNPVYPTAEINELQGNYEVVYDSNSQTSHGSLVEATTIPCGDDSQCFSVTSHQDPLAVNEGMKCEPLEQSDFEHSDQNKILTLECKLNTKEKEILALEKYQNTLLEENTRLREIISSAISSGVLKDPETLGKWRKVTKGSHLTPQEVISSVKDELPQKPIEKRNLSPTPPVRLQYSNKKKILNIATKSTTQVPDDAPPKFVKNYILPNKETQVEQLKWVQLHLKTRHFEGWTRVNLDGTVISYFQFRNYKIHKAVIIEKDLKVLVFMGNVCVAVKNYEKLPAHNGVRIAIKSLISIVDDMMVCPGANYYEKSSDDCWGFSLETSSFCEKCHPVEIKEEP